MNFPVFIFLCSTLIQVYCRKTDFNFKLKKHNEGNICDYMTTVDDSTFNSENDKRMPKNKMRTAIDPVAESEKFIHKLLFGPNVPLQTNNSVTKLKEIDRFEHYTSGEIWRSELYGNKTGVHLPLKEFMYPNHCKLKIRKDYMQTAVNAFAILTLGSVNDVLNLPRKYVLASARTISMMKICHEKLVALWTVVKGYDRTDQITYITLEMYRPLFKYVNAREMAALNLSNAKILTFISTHPELNRHQVGVVAKKYIKTNPNWHQPKYLNLMNNLLCGVPMAEMRQIDDTCFLKLTPQTFYHIYACDPLQRRFYFRMMTTTKALGKPYSWSPRDITRLGLLLTEVNGSDLSTINPIAMSAISAQVMMEMPPESLRFITEMQLRHINQKALNILAMKLKNYKNKWMLNSACIFLPLFMFPPFNIISFN